jgi:hypothetical protein
MSIAFAIKSFKRIVFRSRSPIFAVLCKKISSKGMSSLIGFASCSGSSQEAKTIQRQGEIFLRLACEQAGTLKIEAFLFPFDASKGKRKTF